MAIQPKLVQDLCYVVLYEDSFMQAYMSVMFLCVIDVSLVIHNEIENTGI